ncbi:RNA-guided endonuclease InsQ/TnpB family protein [Leptolyngbya sp. 7M]|uniref:RNA-guided endonuclease InsQ/TnpB family protein n=1 Tax=Leptolyngbya sp. 7M TaxID=2812896 RepID=UPI001B8AAC17|nr:RNA-guided endonuclease TnpB family protein [Leptolyngbya sp. 7M]QYO67707.1 transposase [Leptolyngbya sp. 7M]
MSFRIYVSGSNGFRYERNNCADDDVFEAAAVISALNASGPSVGHAKIARVRADFHHKLSRKIVNENQVIVVEDLAVKTMVKNHTLAQAISDVGWGQFCTLLKYKAEFEGKIYLEIGRFFPSSHLCSNALLPLEKMDLSIRSFVCPHCQERHDRDINAAINIRNEGLRILDSGSGSTALGRDVRPKGGRRKSTLSEAVAVD